MKDDIRKKTCCIIRRNGEYLVAVVAGTRGLAWSNSRYDAWQTRDAEQARRIARRTGGLVMLFNPIINSERIL